MKETKTNPLAEVKKEAREKRSLKETLLFFFFPPRCVLCGERGYEKLCPACRRHFDAVFSPRSFLCRGGNAYADEMISLFPYSDPFVKRLVFQWKNRNTDDLREIFGHYLEEWAEKSALPSRIHRIVYSPRRKSAIRRTGIDQARELAKDAARRFNLPFSPLLKRIRFSLPQHKTKDEKRRQNVDGVFVCRESLSGENILLIDDIVTTGATAIECAKILKQSGAMKVFVLCLCH